MEWSLMNEHYIAIVGGMVEFGIYEPIQAHYMIYHQDTLGL